MANLYDEKILGTKQKIALAQKLRESGQDMLQGQMIGDRYVPASWTQHLAQGLKQGLGAYQEMKGEEELKNIQREKAQATARALNQMGMAAPEDVLKSAEVPAQSPSVFNRIGAFVTGEDQPKGVPAQPYQQAIAQNLTPAQSDAALLNLMNASPELGAGAIGLSNTRATREATAAEKAYQHQKDIIEQDWKEKSFNQQQQFQAHQKEADRALKESMAQLAQSNRQAPQAPSWQIHTNADGSVVQIHPQTGEIRPLEGISGKSAKDESGMTDKSQNDLVAISRQKAAVNSALDVLKQQPEAFSFERGAVETLPFGESLIGRANTPKETEARSQVFNIVSSVIKERAGTAQSAGEKRTLERFLPSATDNSQQIESKFKGFNNYLATQEKGIKDYYKPSAPVNANGFTIEKVSD